MNIIIYGKKRQVVGYYQYPDNGAYMRILLDGGQVYFFAAANQNPHYHKMLVETPTEVREAPDGNGDTLIYADGTQARTGGEIMPFTKTDAEYMTAMRQADAAQPSKEARKRQAVKRAVKVSQAAKDFSVSRPTINKWERGEGKPPENFTLSDLKIYKLCLLAYEKQEQFNDAVVARLKNGKTFSGKQMYQTRKIYRGDIGHGREADYQHPDPNEQ